jgi:3-phenylpropionate/cinnamic acid dioxygenase small subunit
MTHPVRDRTWPDYPGLIEPGRVHGSLYTDPRVFADELARIWYRTGKRCAQSPPSGLRRVVSNIEMLGREGTDTMVGANFVLAESRERGVETWAGRVTYKLRLVDGQLRLAGKQVLLVNRHQSLPTLAFLI